MAGHDDIDEARAATITANIDRAFAFVADAIDDPRLLDLIPDGSKLVIREVWIDSRYLRLAAFLPKEGAEWGARVTGRVGEVDRAGDERTAPPIDPEVLAVTGHGADAEEAIANLEADLNAIVLRGDRQVRRFG